MAQGVEELLPLGAVEHGFSTFIIAADDPRTIQTYRHEVAPALRDAVTNERADAGTSTGPARGARALELRSPAIDYDALPATLAAKSVEPGDRGYGKVRSTYIHRGSPGLVLRAQTV